MSETAKNLMMFFDYVKALWGPILAAMTGHLMRFADGAVHGNRVCLRRFIFESPSIIGFAIIAAGFSEHFRLGYATTCALAAVASWLGNAVVMTLLKPRVAQWVSSSLPKGEKNEKGDLV